LRGPLFFHDEIPKKSKNGKFSSQQNAEKTEVHATLRAARALKINRNELERKNFLQKKL